MTRLACALALCTPLLAACGVDGPPSPPPEREADDRPPPGITIGGSIGVGVTGGSTSFETSSD